MKRSTKTQVKDNVESLLMQVNRVKFVPDKDHSMSLLAAKDAINIFRLVVENQPRANSADVLIKNITGVGRWLQRATAFRLLLTNVTRKVLGIVREAENQWLQSIEDIGAESTGEDDDDDEMPQSPLTMAPPLAARKSNETSAFEPPSANPQQNSGGGGLFPTSSFDTPNVSEMFNDPMMMMSPPTDGVSFQRVESTLGANFGSNDGSDTTSPKGSVILNYKRFRNQVLDFLDEFTLECGSMTNALAVRGPQHIYDREVILTFGCSHSMLRFLEAVAKTKPFHVIALDSEPMSSGKKLCETLPKYEGVTVQRLPDSSCFAVMSRVSKVFLSTEAVLANGGLLAPTGSQMISLAAKHFSVPVVVVTMSLKLCPYYPSDNLCSSLVKMSKTEAKDMLWSTFGNPSNVLGPEHIPHVKDVGQDSVQVYNPVMEYVPPDLVSLFVTNDGEFTTASIHRFVRDHYNDEDAHI